MERKRPAMKIKISEPHNINEEEEKKQNQI